MAYILKSDGTRVDGIEGAGERGKFTLEQMQKAVAGYIEPIPGANLRAYCNEDGRLLRLPLNEVATRMFGQILVGDVLVLEKGDKQ